MRGCCALAVAAPYPGVAALVDKEVAFMKLRSVASLAVLPALVMAVVAVAPGSAGEGRHAVGRGRLHLPEGSAERYTPAILAANRLSRYFVVMKSPSLVEQVKKAEAKGQGMSPAQQRSAVRDAMTSQEAAIRQARSLGSQVFFRYARTANAFSAKLSPAAADALAARSDVASVQPVSIVKLENSTSVPFIGALGDQRAGRRTAGNSTSVRVVPGCSVTARSARATSLPFGSSNSAASRSGSRDFTTMSY